MLNKEIIRHCAPTLAGLKMANAFGYSYDSETAFLEEIFVSNETLRPKGIGIVTLRLWENRALIFVYRKSKLLSYIEQENVRKFLGRYGYAGNDLERHIQKLKYRLAADVEFPHEIGIFLGYPLEDVIGFIENAGQNSKCSGCWKVYCDECEAQKLFAKFDKCKEVYMRLFAAGSSIERLTVAA